jgi:hypothetical protein
MEEYKNTTFAKIMTVITFLVMILVNTLAVVLPLNGISTGDVSKLYPNLFTPAPYTFAIWGVIYLLLLAFTLYQTGLFGGQIQGNNEALLQTIRFYFSISSIANAAWIFAWHYQMIALSVALMLIILFCLITITNEIAKSQLSLKEKLLIQLPFSVYFGWITVATIANITVLLVSLGVNSFSTFAQILTILILAIGAAIGMVTILYQKNIAYGIVLIWAYIGILVNQISEKGFAGTYPMIISTIIFLLTLFIITEVYLLYRKIKH